MSEGAKCWNCNERPFTPFFEGLCETCFRDMKLREAVVNATPKAEQAIEALHWLANSKAGVMALKGALQRTHRTNQQLVCRAIVAMLEKWLEDAQRGPGHWDARNEASVEFARAVFEGVPERKRYFPYI